MGIAATNAMNLYCGTLSTLTVGQTLAPRFSPRARSRALIALLLFGASLILALVASTATSSRARGRWRWPARSW
jgi:NCS1 family nucleobase:cation symporter-1